MTNATPPRQFALPAGVLAGGVGGLTQRGSMMAAYADEEDMSDRYDENTLKDLVSDSGVPADTLEGNTRLLKALSSATGEVKSALLVGGLYTDEDLLALDGESLDYMKQVVCHIALMNLVARRPEKWSKTHASMREAIRETLDLFRGGNRVFEISENIEAGMPTVDGPRQIDYTRLNLLPDRVRNFYIDRKRRLPLGR